MSSVERVLGYDRPDIVLLDNDQPILVVEETVEVPSGHNVGQRFARIAAAAECSVPCFYFGPYAAQKHGGKTAGPRYMNVRLFHAINAMSLATNSAITTINWPVDANFEVRRDREKDNDPRDYMLTFFQIYRKTGIRSINSELLRSDIHKRMVTERDRFVREKIQGPEQYDSPPPSVEILSRETFCSRYHVASNRLAPIISEVVIYNVGMNYIRSDPYTGMAILYKYLYLTGVENRMLVLWFPNISASEWRKTAGSGKRKDIRLFRVSADAILFSDGFSLKSEL